MHEKTEPEPWVYVGTYPDDLGTTPQSPPFLNGWKNAPPRPRRRFTLGEEHDA